MMSKVGCQPNVTSNLSHKQTKVVNIMWTSYNHGLINYPCLRCFFVSGFAWKVLAMPYLPWPLNLMNRMILNTLWKIFWEGLSNSGSRELLNQRCNHLLKWSSEWPLCVDPDSRTLQMRLKVRILNQGRMAHPPQTSRIKYKEKT